ncbi:MAG: hypothetical protein KAH56_07355 [Candidatus Krumholzibacteria bacterium]|nr:hypothetical protein [Candidatus Krumholzibacteria bacterium]
MKSENGMVTLMTVFSGVAALMCLLVGIQLLFLESQIGQAVYPGQVDPEMQFEQWKMLAHTGAIMSFGAGVLIFLFGLRHLTTSSQVRKNRQHDIDPVISTVDLESVSVRIFEVDAEDRSIEITLNEDDRMDENIRPLPRAPLSPDDQESNPEPMGDATDSIVDSIREAATPGSGQATGSSTTGLFWPSFLGRLFRRR